VMRDREAGIIPRVFLHGELFEQFHCRKVQKFTFTVLRQKPFNFVPEFGIAFVQYRDAALARGVVKRLDLLPAFACHRPSSILTGIWMPPSLPRRSCQPLRSPLMRVLSIIN